MFVFGFCMVFICFYGCPMFFSLDLEPQVASAMSRHGVQLTSKHRGHLRELLGEDFEAQQLATWPCRGRWAAVRVR